MAKKYQKVLLPITGLILLGAHLLGSTGHAGMNESQAKGAQIYCFMRITGNDHEVSFNASYEVIKRQKSSIFKTSPKHAAVMIIEAVVENPTEYENCGGYLGDLFGTRRLEPIEINKGSTTKSSPKEINNDRYVY